MLSRRHPKHWCLNNQTCYCGGSNHYFYAASYQQFDANISRAELNDEELPPFAEIESHLLNIDKSHGLTLPSQNQWNYNQHANSTCLSFLIHNFQPRQGTTWILTSCQQQAFSSSMQPCTSNNNGPPQQPNIWTNNPPPAQPRQNHENECRSTTHQACPFQQQIRGARPPLRPTSSNNSNQGCPSHSNNATRQNPSTPYAVACNNCGRQGHYTDQCITASR